MTAKGSDQLTNDRRVLAGEAFARARNREVAVLRDQIVLLENDKLALERRVSELEGTVLELTHTVNEQAKEIERLGGKPKGNQKGKADVDA